MGFDKLTTGLASKALEALEAERERWILWAPVALASGIALYFALPIEPPRWVSPCFLTICMLCLWCGRRFALCWGLFLGLGLAAIGFTAAVERSHAVAAPILQAPTPMVDFQARIYEIEPQEHGVRVVLDHLVLPPLKSAFPPPTMVRIKLPPSAVGLHPGQDIAVRASLLPPPMPPAPRGYDFARAAWFKGLGAVGYAVERPLILGGKETESQGDRLRLWISNRRHELTNRIVSAIDRANIGPGVGATAAALITAERGPVPPEILQAYRDAGLAHILVIAGMHMSMVAGLVFVVIRGSLAVFPPIALRYPIKKWTAAAALVVTFGYLVISGAPVPTQRAFIMNGIILVAVLLDREALSLRSITWAALTVLLMQPEALVGASFQLSFAAVYGLISGYEAVTPHMTEWKRRCGHSWRYWIMFHVFGILLTTQIAGMSTAFYTIFHFNRFATYSLLGNAVAVPVVGLWVMPAALLGFVLLPFGLDEWGWQIMGWGILMVSHVAVWVSSLPGAAISLPSVPVTALIVFTLGGFWLLLWKRRWRLWGLVGMAGGCALCFLQSFPDVMVDSTGKLAAVRGPDGEWAVNQSRTGRSVRQAWMTQAGQGDEVLMWEDLPSQPARCDELGCVLSIKGRWVSVLRSPDALSDDCLRSDVIFIAAPVRVFCSSAKLLVDAVDLQSQGTYQLWIEKQGVRVESTADWQGDRPWSHHPKPERRAVLPPIRDDAESGAGDAGGENSTRIEYDID